MKKADFIAIILSVVFFLPFFLSTAVYDWYHNFNGNHSYIASFIKFALLATFGECIGLRIREGVYNKPGFGILPRAFIWGLIGLMIKAAFVIFANSAQFLIASFGVDPVSANLGNPEFSWMKLFAAFLASAFMNLYFAPVFMTFHKITDLHIMETGGSLRGFFRPFDIAEKFRQIDWNSMWNFVFRKTIIFFWIPAQTMNFMLPEHLRTLVAALLGVVLGVLLSITGIKRKKHDTSHSNVQAERVSVS